MVCIHTCSLLNLFGSYQIDQLHALVSILIHPQLVPADELGKVFGAVAVCGDLANMAGTLVANSIYTPLRFNKIASIGRRYAPSNHNS